MRKLFGRAKSIITLPFRKAKESMSRLEARISKGPFFFLLPLISIAGFVWIGVAAVEKAFHPGNASPTLVWIESATKVLLMTLLAFEALNGLIVEFIERWKRRQLDSDTL